MTIKSKEARRYWNDDIGLRNGCWLDDILTINGYENPEI